MAKKLGCDFVETSAKTRSNLEVAYYTVVRKSESACGPEGVTVEDEGEDGADPFESWREVVRRARDRMGGESGVEGAKPRPNGHVADDLELPHHLKQSPGACADSSRPTVREQREGTIGKPQKKPKKLRKCTIL